MTKALPLPRYMKVDQIVLNMSCGLSMLVALDASELVHDSKLVHDSELESTQSRLRGLEIELATEKKKLSKLQTANCCAHSQSEIFKARVKSLLD